MKIFCIKKINIYMTFMQSNVQVIYHNGSLLLSLIPFSLDSNFSISNDNDSENILNFVNTKDKNVKYEIISILYKMSEFKLIKLTNEFLNSDICMSYNLISDKYSNVIIFNNF